MTSTMVMLKLSERREIVSPDNYRASTAGVTETLGVMPWLEVQKVETDWC